MLEDRIGDLRGGERFHGSPEETVDDHQIRRPCVELRDDVSSHGAVAEHRQECERRVGGSGVVLVRGAERQETESARIDSRLLGRVPHHSDLVAAALQLDSNAEGWRHVSASVPGDKEDRGHGWSPFGEDSGSRARISRVMCCSVRARLNRRSCRNNFQV